MKNRWSRIASALALATVVALLVADSAREFCHTYPAFEVNADYDTDCLGGAQGTVSVSFAGGHSDEGWEAARATVPDVTGDANLEVGEIRWDEHGCTDNDKGTAQFRGLSFNILDDARPDFPVYCDEWEDASVAATVECRQYAADHVGIDSTCTLTLTPSAN